MQPSNQAGNLSALHHLSPAFWPPLPPVSGLLAPFTCPTPPPPSPRWKVLQDLQERNQVLYYRVLMDHFEEVRGGGAGLRGCWAERVLGGGGGGVRVSGCLYA